MRRNRIGVEPVVAGVLPSVQPVVYQKYEQEPGAYQFLFRSFPCHTTAEKLFRK